MCLARRYKIDERSTFFFKINLQLSHPPSTPLPRRLLAQTFSHGVEIDLMASGGRGGELIPLQKYSTCSETRSQVGLIGLWEYMAVRCFTGRNRFWTYIYSIIKSQNPPLETSNPYNEFYFSLCEQKLNSNKDICI
jgi:hypothetical protein